MRPLTRSRPRGGTPPQGHRGPQGPADGIVARVDSAIEGWKAATRPALGQSTCMQAFRRELESGRDLSVGVRMAHQVVPVGSGVHHGDVLPGADQAVVAGGESVHHLGQLPAPGLQDLPWRLQRRRTLRQTPAPPRRPSLGDMLSQLRHFIGRPWHLSHLGGGRAGSDVHLADVAVGKLVMLHQFNSFSPLFLRLPLRPAQPFETGPQNA